MIDQQVLQLMKERLQTEEEHLKAELSGITHRAEGGAGYVPTFPNIGTSEEESSFEVQEFLLNVDLQKKLEKDLALVRLALKKMDEDTYGVCGQCGRQISIERLEVLPEAEFCSDCFEKNNHGG